MTIEVKLDRVIELLEELIAAQTGAAVTTQTGNGKPEATAKAAPAKGGKGKSKAPTLEQVKEVAVAISKDKKVKEGKEKVVALLQRFGCEALKDLDEDKYTEFMEQLGQIRDEGMDPREGQSDEDDPF